eukprot:gnl/MRDRNA2_/MRDRNA2_68727_c0_seq1.p2 gnl/MRDRNA2_/MRDRNA2_68727_c0~~gnl/MRDRNA2_/MRDRNA2_68727_c0_seq1.p2  ORF type:complete len:120 (+),score=22.20 gnl/MRDRNA2_/MRDRNA2_68727_c0_seq1:72-431(+)
MRYVPRPSAGTREPPRNLKLGILELALTSCNADAEVLLPKLSVNLDFEVGTSATAGVSCAAAASNPPKVAARPAWRRPTGDGVGSGCVSSQRCAQQVLQPCCSKESCNGRNAEPKMKQE